MTFDLKHYEHLARRVRVADIDFNAFRAQPLRPRELRCVRYMHDVEHHTACYVRNLLDTGAARWRSTCSSPSTPGCRSTSVTLRAHGSAAATRTPTGSSANYLPKTTDLSRVTASERNAIARSLNGRPRQTLDCRSPSEAFIRAVKRTGRGHGTYRWRSSGQWSHLRFGRRREAVMAKPTQRDAQVMLQLATWYTESQVGEAINWARSDAFVGDYAEFATGFPSGSEGRLLVNRILGYYETVGTLWKNRLINEDLLFDWLWVPASWDLVKGIALGMRAELANAALWENFEAMAERERAVAAKAERKAQPKKATTQKKTPTARKTTGRTK